MADIFDFYVYDDRSIRFEIAEPIMLEDKDVTQIRFRIPKVLNNIDMTDWEWWFIFVNAKKVKYTTQLTLEDDEDDPDNYSNATYTVGYGFSGYVGTVNFSIEALNVSGEDIVNEWHTRTYNTHVIDTLQGTRAVIPEPEADAGTGLTAEEKSLILELFSKAAYAEDDASTAYDRLEALWTVITRLVSLNLSHVTSSNQSASVENGSRYVTTLTADTNYSINEVTVTMGGVDITSTAYSSGTVSIPSVTGNIVITATAVLTAQSITATYTQSGTVYNTDPLNSLKSDLVVTATFKDGSTGIIDAADYTLSGTLAIGTSTITVSYEWKTATFSVTVSEPEHYEYYTVSDADFSTDYSTRLAGLTSEEFAIKIPSHVKSGTITNQLWDCANENTAHITFTDETDFELNRFDTANSDTTKQGALRDITNIPSSVNSMAISAPQITRISDVSNVTSFTFKYNTAMTNLNGIVGLSDNDNITTLKIQENTGLVDLSDFIIPENVSSLNAMFQGCSALEKARIDYNYTSSILSNSGLMFQRTALKRLDIHASDLQSRTMFSGFTFGNGSVEIRCAPNTNTWTYWKDYMESNSTAFRNTYDGALRFCLHSFSAAQKTITVWGDSLTRGGDGTTYSDLCVKLSNMLTNDCVVQNLGAGGTSAANQAQYFAQYDVGYDDITVLFFGHNTPETTISSYNTSYIPHLSKYVVLGLVTKNYTTALNTQMATEYGAHFLDTHAYMVQNGFTITGLTPTAQDETDISNGDVPHSFLADDYIHLNQYGGQIVATAIKEKLLSLGYITNDWLAS